MTQKPVTIVQDLADLSIRLVGPGAMPRIAEIQQGADVECYAAYLHEICEMDYRDALRYAWRGFKLETQPV